MGSNPGRGTRLEVFIKRSTVFLLLLHDYSIWQPAPNNNDAAPLRYEIFSILSEKFLLAQSVLFFVYMLAFLNRPKWPEINRKTWNAEVLVTCFGVPDYLVRVLVALPRLSTYITWRVYAVTYTVQLQFISHCPIVFVLIFHSSLSQSTLADLSVYTF